MAHTTLGNPKEVVLNGMPRKVGRLIVHAGSSMLTHDLIAGTMKTGDASEAIKDQAAPEPEMKE